jgi:type I restriction enzyme R subunit
VAIHNEYVFENEICAELKNRGWLHSPNDSGYNRELALFPEDIFAWLEESQPEQFHKIVKTTDNPLNQKKAKGEILKRLAKTLDSSLSSGGGTLNILRKGFKVSPSKFEMVQFRPADGLNPETTKRYAKNRLRVMQQVHYSNKKRPDGVYHNYSIDLVLFLNGLPVATVELKTDHTQSIHDAVAQYKLDREPKGEPLLSFGTRALVHFAMSNYEVQMTTKLAGKDTFFLPFNIGNNGAAGNPSREDTSPTAYMWEEVWEKDAWLNIFGRFMHLEREQEVDPVTGEKKLKETLLFPRFHQWSAVTKLLEATKTAGPGSRYLIQHSAGSGKTNSIAWLAHQLSTLHSNGSKVFDSVIVITDRTVLDDQLQSAIKQIDAKTGVVAAIGGTGAPKSRQLMDALKSNKPIIVVTIQTFPFVLDKLHEAGEKAGKNFAIIADEAHTSQTGTSASKLKAVLTEAEFAELEDEGDVDIEAALLAEMEARAASKNLSFYAFTATPKAKTLEIFGTKNEAGLPEPFHLYTMQQAIEEKFILDVLQNYTPYKVAFKLAHNGQEYDSDAPLVDQAEAVKDLMNWLRLHPTNIQSKVSIVIEHFRSSVMHLLGGKAKAMVVTGSRKEAVRYKLAFDKYIAENKYSDVKALVAFSGDVDDPQSGPKPFNEKNMNPNLKGKSLPEAFKTNDYQVMLVANKYQTGFDQPLLCAMYVDKRLSGVNAVQTLSRLNRVATGKDSTFILDFVNEPEEIRAAFLPYFKTAQLTNVTDKNIVLDLERKLDSAGIFDKDDVLLVSNLIMTTPPGKGNNALTAALGKPRDSFKSQLAKAREVGDNAEIDRLEDFRQTIKTYLKTYGFLSQVYDYADSDLERLYIFLKQLDKLIADSAPASFIDLSEIELVRYQITEQSKLTLILDEEGSLGPVKAGVGHQEKDPTLVLLEEAIAKVNDLVDFSDEGDVSGRIIVEAVNKKLLENKQVVSQARVNTEEQFLGGQDLNDAVVWALIALKTAAESASDQILSSPDKTAEFLKAIGKVFYASVNAPIETSGTPKAG